LDVKIIHGYRRFCNKIYQATKYVLGKLGAEFRPLATSAKTGKESLAERWILHKFAIAAKEINVAIEERDFSVATSVIYQFWYNQLCDVFIENSKALISDGTPDEQLSAKNTLYTALEAGLTMIHPFMPFLTEELWQRLPRRPGDKTPSIVLAAYPTYDASLDDPASAEAYELVLSVSKAVRSLMAEYAIKSEGVLYVQAFDEVSRRTCAQQLPSIRSLSGKGVSSISLVGPSDTSPVGCIPFAVSSSATVFLLIKGHVDIDREIEKAKRKLERASEVVKKQTGILNDDSYRAKASEKLQELERNKLRDAEAEVKEMTNSLQQFGRLKLEHS
jgi:valyl-tRNA synthetase